MSYKEEFRHITTFVFDVDGVFTDGSITILPDGEMIRTMNTKDGYAVKAALHAGYGVVYHFGRHKRSRKNAPQSTRCQRRVFGCTSKGEVYCTPSAKKTNISFENMLFMGDDIPDVEAMNLVRLGCCPNGRRSRSFSCRRLYLTQRRR